MQNGLSIHSPVPLLKHSAPSGLIVGLNKQEAKNRNVLHLLYFNLSIKNNRKVNSATLVPQNQSEPFKLVGNRVEFTLKNCKGTR